MGFFSWQSSVSGKSMMNDHARRDKSLTGQWIIKDGKGREDRFNFTDYDGYGVFEGQLESSGSKGFIDIYEVFGGVVEDPEISVEFFVHDDESGIDERLRLFGIDAYYGQAVCGPMTELRNSMFPRLLLNGEIEANRQKVFADFTAPEDCPDQGFFTSSDEDDED